MFHKHTHFKAFPYKIMKEYEMIEVLSTYLLQHTNRNPRSPPTPHTLKGCLCLQKNIIPLFNHFNSAVIFFSFLDYSECEKSDLHKLLHHFVTVILIKHNYIWRCDDHVRDNDNKKRKMCSKGAVEMQHYYFIFTDYSEILDLTIIRL